MDLVLESWFHSGERYSRKAFKTHSIGYRDPERDDGAFFQLVEVGRLVRIPPPPFLFLLDFIV